jgi:hypothetical protein
MNRGSAAIEKHAIYRKEVVFHELVDEAGSSPIVVEKISESTTGLGLFIF